MSHLADFPKCLLWPCSSPNKELTNPFLEKMDIRTHRQNWDYGHLFQGCYSYQLQHGLLGMRFRLLLSCYLVSLLFHLVKHMASESAFRGMGLFLSLSLFPSVICGHGMQLVPPCQMGKETNTVLWVIVLKLG